MIEIKARWKSVRDREKWAGRGASFVAKAKATKVVWFPPTPVETGKKAASTGKRKTKKATKKSTGVAQKATNATEHLTSPVRRKKTSGARSAMAEGSGAS